MSKIISIGTALPKYKHLQNDILQFMQNVYALNDVERRKLRFLYHQSEIQSRYSVIPDYSRSLPEWKFYPQAENLEPFPSLEKRLSWFNQYAPGITVNAIQDCIEGRVKKEEITHLVTVSCTGMSAPGLDLQVMELMELPRDTWRTSINFMGCYAAIHALKLADSICRNEKNAKVVIVCTELCTLHFQREATTDNIASSLLFGDGCAAALITHDDFDATGLRLESFYAEVVPKGKKDMAWELSSSGFLMTLSGYVPALIEEDFEQMVARALSKAGYDKEAITQWCIHPGGKKILEIIHKTLHFKNGELNTCYEVLKEYGNMSSATILFVLKKLMESITHNPVQKAKEHIFGAAFGPGLTMETFVASC